MQKILVPCDFSEPSIQGLRFAVEVATVNAAELVVLSVIDPRQQENEPFVSERFKESFEELAREISQPVQISQQIRTGKFVATVMEAITEHAIDLVVVGTRGSRGWQGIFMGSNVEKVVRTSPVPVFAARQLTHLRDIKNIIFPCDLIHADHYGLDQLKKLQVQLGARLHLLRVDTTGHADHEMLTEEIKNYARFHGLSKYSAHVIASPDEKDGILQFAKETGADMIAMTTRGASDLNHLYNFSVAADVVNHSHLLTWTCLQQGMSQYVA